MSYRKSWHRDYAAESIKRKELNRFSAEPSHEWALYAVECGEVAELARQTGVDIGNDSVASVATSVLDVIAESHERGARCRRKITDKQREVLAVVLLEKFGTARGIAAAAWGLTDVEIDAADA